MCDGVRPSGEASVLVLSSAAMTSQSAHHAVEVHGQSVHFTTSEDLSFIPDGSVDFIMTSPPYWNLKDYGHPDQIGPSSFEDYLQRLNKVWDECYRVAAPGSVFVLNIGNRRHKKRYFPIGLHIWESMKGWELWDTLIWYVPNALPQPNHYMERLFDNKYEFLFVYTKDGATDYTFHKPRVPQKYIDADPRSHKKNARGRCIGNVIRVPAYKPPNVRELGYHQAAYPEELVALMLESFTDEGDVVLDPFVGSGTTLKVARHMNRRGIGVELNAEFAPLIERRISERWELPEWTSLDILHSSTMVPGSVAPRKIHLLKDTHGDTESLFEGDAP
jgi:modification methylase